MRFAILCLVVACRSQSREAQPPEALPATSATVTPPRICEPTITCGMWSRCQWLDFDHAERGYDVFRISGSDAGGYGSHYWRVHQCWPDDAGPKNCAIYCDAKGTCLDGFTSDGPCTGSAVPRPSPFVCEARASDCVTLPPKSP